jgi:hypothetical protein
VAHVLAFDAIHDYGSASVTDGITLPIVLSTGHRQVNLTASVDTGASCCIFKRGYGEALGLDVESGTPTSFRTVTGTFETYGHVVTLAMLDLSFEAMVYFTKDENYTRNVLGRRGWLDQVRLGIVEYESKLYLSRYDES